MVRQLHLWPTVLTTLALILIAGEPNGVSASHSVTSNKTVSTSVDSEDVCSNVACKRIAARILVQTDTSTKPCSNFYGYACGGLYKDEYILQHDFNHDVRKRIIAILNEDSHAENNTTLKFVEFVKSCMFPGDMKHSQWVDAITEVLLEIGIPTISRGEEANFTRLFAGFIKYNRPLFFDVLLDLDYSGRFELKLVPVIDTLQTFRTSDRSKRCEKYDISKKKVTNLKKLYQAIRKCKEDINSTIANELREVVNLCSSSKFFTVTDEEIREALPLLQNYYETITEYSSGTSFKTKFLSKKYNSISVGELNRKYPLIEWDILLGDILRRPVWNDTSVQVHVEEYFQIVFNLLSSNIKMNWYKAMLFSFMHKLYSDLYLHTSKEDHCLSVATHLMGDVVSGMYLSTFRKKDLLDMANSTQYVFALLKKTMEKQIENGLWLESSSKSALLTKLQNISLVVDSSLYIYRDTRFLQQQLTECNISNDNYMKNFLALNRRYRHIMYSSIEENPREPKNIWTHFIFPHEPNVVSIRGLNLVAVPYTVLVKPFNDPRYPMYVTLARIGSMLAYALTQHFDTVGMEDTHGSFIKSRLGRGAESYYESMKKCYLDMYSFQLSRKTLSGKDVELDLVAEATIDQRLADDMATQLVYSVFKENRMDLEPRLPFLNMSNEQVLFLLLSQNFCTKESMYGSAVSLFEQNQLPYFLRVSNLLTNTEGLVKGFHCPSSKQCPVFPELLEPSMDYGGSVEVF